MTWFKVDDSFAFHRKIVAAGSALTLWVRAGAWCAQQLTDGRVPDEMVSLLGPKRGAERDASRLVEVGLWERVDGGFQFHDWQDYQPTKAAVEHKRQVRAAAGAKGGAVSGAKRSASKIEAADQANASPLLETWVNPRPDPTRPTEPNGSAQTLLAEWIDHCGDTPPPSRVKGQVSKELKGLLDDGIPYDAVRTGLAAWHDKGLHPSTLASVVHETRTAPTRRGKSTTDDRVQQALTLATQLEAGEHNHHAIEGRAS